jgi:regulatory protein
MPFRKTRAGDLEIAPKPLKLEDALQYAVRALSARALTEAELSRKLRARNASAEVVTQTLERLRELKFIDDSVIAARASEDTQLGRFGIQRKLSQRGVHKHVIEDALTERDADVDLQAAQALVERYAPKWTGERAYQKGMAFLMRRGFSGEVTRRALQAWAQRKNLDKEDVDESESA